MGSLAAKRIPLFDLRVVYEPIVLPSTGASLAASCRRSHSFPGEPTRADVPLHVSNAVSLPSRHQVMGVCTH